MHILLAVGVTVLTTIASAQTLTPPQTLLTAANANKPMSVSFNKTAPFEDAISILSKSSGVPIEFDQTVTEETRRQPMTDSMITLRNVILEEAVAVLTGRMGLSYIVLEGKMIRIFKKA
jgi:hypothetical protein